LHCRVGKGIFFAGQITGSEGYVAAIAGGYLAGVNAARLAHEEPLLAFPTTTMIGALFQYTTSAEVYEFQPMKPNFGLLPPLKARVRGKKRRYEAYAQRALQDLGRYTSDVGFVAGSESTPEDKTEPIHEEGGGRASRSQAYPPHSPTTTQV
jgi:methylenetetrahydrofolate--tRNA-(uracil-5-)-methyltransferase